MPVERYRITRPIPPVLDYMSASYALEIVSQPHVTIPVTEWVFRARKLRFQTVCVIVTALAHRQRLLERLEGGFEVEAGTPAAKIMARLEKDGIAEKATGRRR